MKSSVVRDFIYPASDILSGRRMLASLDNLKRSQWYSRRKLGEMQLEKLKTLLFHAAEYSPFYRERFRKQGFSPASLNTLSDMASVPLLEKQDIIANYENLKSKAYPPKKMIINYTGGSTGLPLKFVISKGSLSLRAANKIRLKEWCGYELGEPVAKIWGSPVEMEGMRKFLRRAGEYLKNITILDAFALDEDKMARFYRLLKKASPRIIMGYSSALRDFADFMLASELPSFVPGGAVISTAETLFEKDKEKIEEAFGLPVFNRYGSREFGDIAQECEERRGLHICSENVFVEILADGKPVTGSGEGEIVVTDLNNFAMPMIRYRTGDSASFSEIFCNCGRGLPLLDKVNGRVSAMILTEDGRRIHGEFFTHLFYGSTGVKSFQVLQKTRASISINIVKDDKAAALSAEEIRRRVAELFPGEIQINFADEIKPLASGKRQFIKSEAL